MNFSISRSEGRRMRNIDEVANYRINQLSPESRAFGRLLRGANRALPPIAPENSQWQDDSIRQPQEKVIRPRQPADPDHKRGNENPAHDGNANHKPAFTWPAGVLDAEVGADYAAQHPEHAAYDSTHNS